MICNVVSWFIIVRENAEGGSIGNVQIMLGIEVKGLWYFSQLR